MRMMVVVMMIIMMIIHKLRHWVRLLIFFFTHPFLILRNLNPESIITPTHLPLLFLPVSPRLMAVQLL